MSGSKDSFEILADELARMGQQIAHLQRTSLNKNEADALNQKIVEGVEQMSEAGRTVHSALSKQMSLGLDKLRLEAIIAATEVANMAIEKSHAESLAAAQNYSKAAGEARREAWRYFGGFWVWLASIGAGGAVLGLLAAFLIIGRGDAREFGQYPGVYCTTAGGQVITNPEGRRFCAIWIDRPSQSGG